MHSAPADGLDRLGGLRRPADQRSQSHRSLGRRTFRAHCRSSDRLPSVRTRVWGDARGEFGEDKGGHPGVRPGRRPVG
jgi:hypothetical protein